MSTESRPQRRSTVVLILEVTDQDGKVSRLEIDKMEMGDGITHTPEGDRTKETGILMSEYFEYAEPNNWGLLAAYGPPTASFMELHIFGRLLSNKEGVTHRIYTHSKNEIKRPSTRRQIKDYYQRWMKAVECD